MNEFQDESPFAVVVRHQRSLPVDIDAIAIDLGMRVQRVDLGPGVAGQIIRDPKSGRAGFRILINSSDHRRRQRFTLAHEISHYILHRDLIENGVIDDTMYRSAELSSSHEVQANRLAADILMPKHLIRKYVNELGPDVYQLARDFEVSPKAMEIRLTQMGVL